MSVDSACLKDEHVAISLWQGEVTHEQWIRNVARVLADPDLPTTSMHLVDLRSVDATTIGEPEIKDVVGFLQSQGERIKGRRIAIVATSEFNKSILFQRLMGHQFLNTIVFNELQTACTWLNLDAKRMERAIEDLRRKISGGT